MTSCVISMRGLYPLRFDLYSGYDNLAMRDP